MYNLLFVDVGFGDKYPTYVHKMNVITGDHIRGQMLRGTVKDQIDDLIDMIINEKPDKIIFDKTGAGINFYEGFRYRAKIFDRVFTVDAFGLITYV